METLQNRQNIKTILQQAKNTKAKIIPEYVDEISSDEEINAILNHSRDQSKFKLES